MKPATRVVSAGRHPERFDGAINTPVFRASTVLSPTLADWNAKKAVQKQGARGFYYGRSGTPTGDALLEAISELEGGHDAMAFPSGLAACAAAILSVVHAGDHILMVDTVYGPVRRLADGLLKRIGVTTQFFDPLIGTGIKDLIGPRTRLVYLESPGSHTMEISDVPSIADSAHRNDAVVVLDNTWSGLSCFAPFDKGVDIAVHSATKYVVGHADAVLGLAIANEALWPRLRATALDLGQTASPDDAYLALRGLRTLAVRMRQHDQTGRLLADWLAEQPEVSEVMHPARPSDPGHALWLRDFTGASGLFSIRLAPPFDQLAAELIDNLDLFGIGASWGGFESLILPAEPVRTASERELSGLIRIHAGLEDPNDLIADLQKGFTALRRARTCL